VFVRAAGPNEAPAANAHCAIMVQIATVVRCQKAFMSPNAEDEP